MRYENGRTRDFFTYDSFAMKSQQIKVWVLMNFLSFYSKIKKR